MNRQPQQQTSGQTHMQKPPGIISTKDLLYLQDMMSWNLNAMKKTHFFANQAQDQEVKNALHAVCTLHERHYQKLLNHLAQHLQTAQNPMNRGMES